MRRVAISLIIGVLLAPAVARGAEGDPRPVRLHIAGAVNGGTIARVEPAEWKRTDRVTLYLVIEAEVEGRDETVFFTGVPVLEVNGEGIDPSRVMPWPSGLAEPGVRWYEMVNQAQQEMPGAPWEDIEEVELEAARDAWRTDVRPGSDRRLPGVPPHVGTGRYAVVVTLGDGRSLRTPGVESLVAGRPEDVFRVTLRRDNSFAGWVCAFWGVPYKSDADTSEVTAFAAVNGAALALGAYRGWTGATLPEIQAPPFGGSPWETFLEEVHDHASGSDGPFHDPDGERIAWGESRNEVRAGDLLVAQGRLAVLWSDASPGGKPDGKLGPDDLVIVADGAPPGLVPLRSAVPQPLRILRFRDFTFLQIQLRQIGLYRGKNTGVFDALTQDALRSFQEREGLEPSGLPDQATLVALLRAHRQALRR